MRKTNLSELDKAIGERLRKAREEYLQITQSACARQLGLDRSTLANYEACRTPLRFEVALSFCRNFIISEEWLATGKFDAYHQALLANGQEAMDAKTTALHDDIFSIRQCVDLWSEAISRHIRPGTPFSDAYERVLGQRYAEIALKNPYSPRVLLSEADETSTALNYIQALLERDFQILTVESIRRKIEASTLWRVYSFCICNVSGLIGKRLCGVPLAAEYMAKFEWLRAILTDPTITLPPLVDGVWNPRILKPDDSIESNLPTVNYNVNSFHVPRDIPELLVRLNAATKAFGKKSELAHYLDVALPTVSVWLSGKREPSGGTTLRLLEWVQAEEAKQKSPSIATTTLEQRTQLRRSVETKPQSGPKGP